MTLSSTSLSPALLRVLAASVVGASLLGAFGCGSNADPSQTAPAPATQAVPASHLAGPGGFVLNAVNALDLRPDQQQAIAAIRADLQSQAAPMRAARAAVGTELASEVRAGQIDQARLQPLVDAVKTAGAGMKPAMASAMQQIHDTLDASQRASLAATLRDRAETPAAGHAKGQGHWRHLTADLNLTEDQQTAIHTAMHDAFAARKAAMAGQQGQQGQRTARLSNLADAFEAETFDTSVLGGGGQHPGAGRFAGMETFLATAVPLLTPAQRAILATKIEAHSQAAAAAAE